jgi:hypothetical protein
MKVYERRTIAGIQQAKTGKATDLVVVSETMHLADTLAPDFVEFSDFIYKCYKAIDIIKQRCRYNWCSGRLTCTSTAPTEGKTSFKA